MLKHPRSCQGASPAAARLVPCTPMRLSRPFVRIFHQMDVMQNALVALHPNGFTKTSRPATCTKATGFNPSQPATSPLPASQEQAVAEAVQCASARLKPRFQNIKTSSKGFGSAQTGPTNEVLHIEIPTADASPSTIAQLAADAASQVAGDLGPGASPVTIVCCNAQVMSAVSSSRSKPSGCKVMELRQACRESRLDGGLLVLVAPAVSDVALCEQLTKETWAGKAVVIINAEFLTANPTSLGIPLDLHQFVEEILTVYCLMPVAVKGLLGDKEGVVLRKVASNGKAGSGESQPWRILMKAPGSKSDDFLQIGQTKRRPSSDDIQLAFINANAANSPINRLVSKIKGK